MNHSKTYTVLDENEREESTLISNNNEELFGKKVDHSVLHEAIKIVKEVDLSSVDIERLIQACVIIDGYNNKNTLVTLLRISQNT